MTQTGLEAIARAEGDATVIELRGEIDGSARDALRAAYDAGRADGPLMLDFAAVDYINSTGIALIVGLLARARAEARRGQRARALGSLPRDLRDHPALRLHDHHRPGSIRMTDTATPFQVRAPSPGVTVIEIAGEVTRESDLQLQDAYERAGDGHARDHPLLRRPRVHELERHRPARHAARARTAQPPADARVRAHRPLPPDLRAHPPRRGDLDSRHRGRGDRTPQADPPTERFIR